MNHESGHGQPPVFKIVLGLVVVFIALFTWLVWLF